MVNGLLLRQVCVRTAALLSLVVLCAPAPARAGSFALLDRTFVRETGEPETVTFALPAPRPGTYHLRIETDGVASAIVTLNGTVVVRTNDFSNNVRLVERAITLQAQNRFTVELRGAPGGTLRLFIGGEDNDLPVIRASVDPAANASGWHRDSARVTFVCTDATPGIATCPAPVMVTGEGRGQVVSGQAVDKAGNVATASGTINLDRTAPTIAPTVLPPANGEEWHNADPTISFSCADALSGVGSCPPPQTVSREGAAQPVAAQVTDTAGNVATASISINLDKTAPRITAALSAPANAAGWHNAPVTVTFTCEDAGSGVASCRAR